MKKIISIILCILLFCSCSNQKSKVDDENPNFGGVINIFSYYFDTVNPLLTKYQTNAQSLSLCYNSLFKENQDLTYSNDAAKNYRFTNDNNAISIYLKNNITFSDGSKLTAHNVKNSLDMLKTNPDSMYYKIFDFTDSYNVVSDYEININLKKQGMGVLSHLTFPIVKDSENFIGSGPYILTNRSTDKLVLSARNEKGTNIQTINILAYPSIESMGNAFMTNEINVFASDFYKLAQTSTKSKVNKYEYVSDYYTFLGFNLENDSLKNVYTRYAIACCINKNDMINNLLIGYATPTNSVFKPNTLFNNLSTYDFTPNSDKVQEYLQKSGYNKNYVFKLLVNEEGPAKVRTAEYIASRLVSEGIKTEVVSVNYDEYIEKLESGDFDLFIGEYEMAQDYDISFMLGSEFNYFRFYDQSVFDLINNFNRAVSGDMRQAYANELQIRLRKKLPFISLYYRNNILITDDNIKGTVKPTQSDIYRTITSWTVK